MFITSRDNFIIHRFVGRNNRKAGVKGCFSHEQKHRKGRFYYFLGYLSHKSMNWKAGKVGFIPRIYELLSHQTVTDNPRIYELCPMNL